MKRADSNTSLRNLVAQVMEHTGVGRNTAYERVFKWERGHYDCDMLFRPRRTDILYVPTRNPLIDEVAAAAGLTRSSAKQRVWRVRHGLMPEEYLMLTTEEIRARKSRKRSAKRRKRADAAARGGGDWDDLGLGPRRSIASIPGGTAWERRELGQ